MPTIGALLFPATKYKDVVVMASGKPLRDVDDSSSLQSDALAASTLVSLVNTNIDEKISFEDQPSTSSSPMSASSPINAQLAEEQKKKQVLVHRFLVISRERFIVLDSNGQGIGSEATVKSNHHLTEV